MNGSRVELLAVALASGKAMIDAAREAGMSERSAYRVAAEAEFKARVEGLRRSMVDAAVGKLAGAATEATETLRGLLAPNAPPTVRLGAARAILEKLIDVQTHTELTARIGELERVIHARQQPVESTEET
jgi:hypothetical protein